MFYSYNQFLHGYIDWCLTIIIKLYFNFCETVFEVQIGVGRSLVSSTT